MHQSPTQQPSKSEDKEVVSTTVLEKCDPETLPPVKVLAKNKGNSDIFSTVKISRGCCCSVAQLYLTLCDPMDCSTSASLSFTVSQNWLKLMSIELVMPSNHPILCHPLLLLPSVFPSSRFFSNELSLHTRWPKYWRLSGKESACQCRRQEFDPSPRENPHAAEQPSPTTSTEAVLWSLGSASTAPARSNY